MSVEVYTVENGLEVQAKDMSAPTRTYSRSDHHTFVIQVPHGSTSIRCMNDLNRIRLSYLDAGIASMSNTGSDWQKATWHLSIGRKDEPIDPWQLWEEAGFKVANVEVVTGRAGAKPWLLSFRRRGSPVDQINKAAAKHYKEKVAMTRKLLQLSLPPTASTRKVMQPSISTPHNRRTSIDKRTDKPKKGRSSRSSSIASSVSGSDAA